MSRFGDSRRLAFFGHRRQIPNPDRAFVISTDDLTATVGQGKTCDRCFLATQLIDEFAGFCATDSDVVELADPMIECHREFLAKLEEQLELQRVLVKQMADLQEQFLRKLD